MLGEGLQVGTLRYDLQGRRENAAFEYGAGWLGDPARFALGPTLPFQAGPQFHRKSKDGSLFHAAIADTEPDGWAKRVIMRDHIKRRQALRREGKKKRRSRSTHLIICWPWMISAVSARFVFATKTACSSARRKKDAGLLRHSSNLGICSARRVLSRRTKRRQRTLRICAGVARHLAACARNARSLTKTARLASASFPASRTSAPSPKEKCSLSRSPKMPGSMQPRRVSSRARDCPLR